MEIKWVGCKPALVSYFRVQRSSLELLCAVLDIPTPKDDINGSEVGRVYWQENNLERIQTYCQKDVLAIAQLMRRYNYLPLIAEDYVDYTN